MMPISLSLVTYNNDLTELNTLMDSVKKLTIEYSMYVIDNSPSKDIESFFSPFPNVIYMHTGKNVGFGAGHNIALKEVLKKDFTYHLFVNPDVYFEEGEIEN